MLSHPHLTFKWKHGIENRPATRVHVHRDKWVVWPSSQPETGQRCRPMAIDLPIKGILGTSSQTQNRGTCDRSRC